MSPCKLRTLSVIIRRNHSRLISGQEREEFWKSLVRSIADVIQHQYCLETIHLGFTGRQLRDAVLASSEFTALAASLTSFVARPQFHTLDICRFPAPADVVADTVCAFLVSPCSHPQTLKLPRYMPLSSRQLLPATPCPAAAMPVPDTGVEYKELYLHQELYANESYLHICKTVFAFPKIRLRFLVVGCFKTRYYYVNTLHMAAQHPDIQVKALSICLQCGAEETEEVFPTLRDDMRALLQIPTLTSLRLPSGMFVRHTNIGNRFLPILAQELPKRRHLAAIEELDMGRSNFLELPAEEVEHLFQSIFSLPHLSQLTLKMNHCVVSFHHYKLIHRLWTEYSSGDLLKKLVLGSVMFMSENEHMDEISVIIMPLLEGMAQSTSVVRTFGQLTDVETDLIKANLQTSK